MGEIDVDAVFLLSFSNLSTEDEDETRSQAPFAAEDGTPSESLLRRLAFPTFDLVTMSRSLRRALSDDLGCFSLSSGNSSDFGDEPSVCSLYPVESVFSVVVRLGKASPSPSALPGNMLTIPLRGKVVVGVSTVSFFSENRRVTARLGDRYSEVGSAAPWLRFMLSGGATVTSNSLVAETKRILLSR